MNSGTILVNLQSSESVVWEFRPEGGVWQPISVPAGGWRAQGRDVDAGVYRARVPIPAEARDRVVRVKFAAVNFGAEVFAGPDEDNLVLVGSHVNGWMPFTADITQFAEPGGSVLLVVEVKGRNKFLRDGKYIVPQGGTWLPTLADGIIRGVELEILPKVFIDDVFVRTSVTDDTLGAEVTVWNATDETVEVAIKSGLASWNGDSVKYPKFAPVTATLLPGERRTVALEKVGWGLGRESFWWPNVPYREGYRAKLHILDLVAEVDGQAVHAVSRRFGFKEFQARGNAYYLNNVHTNLRGDNQQEANFGTDAYGIFPGFGAPTQGNAGWPGAVDNLQRLNFNVLRVHQVPPTPYILDVCDEMGLMIIDESPVRGSERMEDFVGGRENMVNADRELALRDRNHPSVIIWSAGNETWDARSLILACMAAIMEVDDTRPIIVDGVPDMGAPIINMNHYVGGLGIFPEQGGYFRTDRPYGETESIWPTDNTLKGFAWMGTSTRVRRLKGNSDIRNYVLNNAWPNYVPGQGPELQMLEKKVKNIRWYDEIHDILPAIPDPWTNPNIILMQKSFNPVPVWDIRFDEANKLSNEAGEWPVVKPELIAGRKETRQLAVFNDEFSGDEIKVTWELRLGSRGGRVYDSGEFLIVVPFGEFRKRNIDFIVPGDLGDLCLALRSSKGGEERYSEDLVCFSVVSEPNT